MNKYPKSILHVPLHVHTEYSLLDGASKIPELVARAKKLELPALAISDHGVMYGCYEFFQECKKEQIKPIIGSEIYVINGDHTENQRVPLYHLVLLAKNSLGYQNLSKIVSEGCLNGFYYKPRISKEFLETKTEGLICLSACLGGEVPNLLLQNKYPAAKEAALFYQKLFGEDFYLEIQDHGIKEESFVNSQIIQLSKEIGAKVVATNDSHYTERTDAIAHDAILCLQTNKQITDFPRMKFSGSEFLKSGAEMFELFAELKAKHSSNFIREIVEQNTLEILEKIENYQILEDRQAKLPKSPVPPGESDESYLRKLAYVRAEKRYGGLNESIRERLDYELRIIEDSGFAGYFLIVADFISYARKQQIPVGPGRGSAAGSLVAYALGITDIDPLRFKLLFERFLNPERKSMPDIDTDFCIERRAEVIDYVRKLYGEEKVSQIITFNKLTSKAVIKDISRVMGYSYRDSETLAKMVPVVRGKPRKISWMIENHPEFKEAYQKKETGEVIKLALKVEGTNKTFGVHAAGIIIGNRNLQELVPLAKSKEKGVVSQYPMDHLADLGLLKMDFLGLRNLTVIERALQIVAKASGQDKIDISQISLEDPLVYQMLSRGDLMGIFQLETSSGMKQVAREMKPSNIEDISAIIALYRPGPLDTGMIDEFIQRKQGKRKIVYKTPELKEILEDTYGTIVYQEQIMQIAQKLANFSLGQADLLRRAMGKKKPAEMEKYKDLFLEGCKKNQIKLSIAEELFEMMLAFAEYCFNRSHSAAYALISYQTAWLKAHYPVEYLTALMSSVSQDQDKTRSYITEAKKLEIQVLPPEINSSGSNFTALPKKREIRFGLAAVKNVGEKAVQEIIRARNSQETKSFDSLEHLCREIDLKIVNRKSLESLILAGAFDQIIQLEQSSRKELLNSLDSKINLAQKEQNRKKLGQTSLFNKSFNKSFNKNFKLTVLESSKKTRTNQTQKIAEEFSSSEIQKIERDLLGFYVTGHPLLELEQEISALATSTILELKNEIKENQDGTQVNLLVLFSEIKKKMTKANKLMAVAIAEDLSGEVEIVFFSGLLEKLAQELKEERPYLLKAKIQIKSEGDFSLIAQSLQTLESLELLYLKLKPRSKAEKEKIDWQARFIKLSKILRKYKGDSPVILSLNTEKACLDQELWVNLDTLEQNELTELGWLDLELSSSKSTNKKN